MSVTRDKNGRLLPGSRSLNPGGRPRTPEHVKAMLDGLTEKAVLALEDALDGDDPKLRLAAAQRSSTAPWGGRTQVPRLM